MPVKKPINWVLAELRTRPLSGFRPEPAQHIVVKPSLRSDVERVVAEDEEDVPRDKPLRSTAG